MIDTHAHIDFPDFDSNRNEIIQRFINEGGEKIINVGCDMSSSQRCTELAKENDIVFAAVGIHPHDAGNATIENLKILEELLLEHKTVAVGEIGMDFFKVPNYPAKIQEEAFRLQLELAENHKKPIIIHCREAYMEVLEILKSYKTSNWQGVLHCFTAGPEIAEKFLELGFHIGFTGVITYYKKNSQNESFLFDTLKNMPLEKILVETDAPYLAPVPNRGQLNEPVFVKYVIQKIAEVREMREMEIELITSSNARKLFGI